MKYLKTYTIFENEKYSPISEQEFYDLFNKNCKNYSVEKDQLFRGDSIKYDLLYHQEKFKRNPDYFPTFADYFDTLTDLKKYPVQRSKSTIGIAGGDVEEMVTITSRFKDGNNSVYKVIPYDNSEIVFCPIFDLILLEWLNIHIADDDFIKVKYNKRFKVPVEKLKEIQDRLLTPERMEKISKLKLIGNKSIPEKGFEFFTSSPCLLVNINSFQNNLLNI